MDSDELMDVDFPSAIFKGKSKAVEHDLPSDNDNLPWYV
jgi:replication factor C subunit 3/5